MRKRAMILISLVVVLLALLLGGFALTQQRAPTPGPLASPSVGAEHSPTPGITPTLRGIPGATLATAPSASSTPAANGALQAQAGDTTILLSWQAQTGASGYLVFRDGAAVPLDLAPTVATQYLDIGLTNGRTYTYTVALLDLAGQPGLRLAPVAAVPRSH